MGEKTGVIDVWLRFISRQKNKWFQWARETIVAHGRLDESGFSMINSESVLAKKDNAGTFVWLHPNETFEDNRLKKKTRVSPLALMIM